MNLTANYMRVFSFGNWAVQRCLEAASTADERRKIVHCMRFEPHSIRSMKQIHSSSFRGRVVDLASNCYGCHVLQKALDCEEDVRLLIVSELLLGDPAQTLVNKHASHVWSKVTCGTLYPIERVLIIWITDHGVDMDRSSTAHIRLVSYAVILEAHGAPYGLL